MERKTDRPPPPILGEPEENRAWSLLIWLLSHLAPEVGGGGDSLYTANTSIALTPASWSELLGAGAK